MKKSCAHVSAAVTIALFGFSPGMFNVALYCINLTQVIGRVLVAEVEEASGGVTGGDVTWTATEELSPNRTQSVAGGKAVAAVPELGARVVVVALPVGLGRVLPWTATCEALEHVTAGVYVAQGAEARHEMVIPSWVLYDNNAKLATTISLGEEEGEEGLPGPVQKSLTSLQTLLWMPSKNNATWPSWVRGVWVSQFQK